jgi:hypothetical protein
MLPFTKGSVASVAKSCGKTNTKEHFLTDTTRNPDFISDFNFIVMRWIKFLKVCLRSIHCFIFSLCPNTSKQTAAERHELFFIVYEKYLLLAKYVLVLLRIHGQMKKSCRFSSV